MARFKLTVLAGIVILFVVAGFGVFNQAGIGGSTAYAASNGAQMGLGTPGPHSKAVRIGQPRIVGAAAIRPRTGVVSTSSPAFTKADVRSYLATDPFQGKISSTGKFTIAKIEFITDQEAAAILLAEPGLASDALVCLVEVKGHFTVSGPGGSSDSNQAGSSTAYYVFDAHTGNLLLQATR